jgi:uncharacterized RDD family membrane protein YckC
VGQPLTARRIVGFAIDLLITMLSSALALLLLGALAPQLESYAEVAFTSALLVYFLLTSALPGATPGQRVMGLTVTQLDRSAPTLWQRLPRPVAGILGVASFGSGFFWAVRAPRHQATHDILTRTLVLRRRQNSEGP